MMTAFWTVCTGPSPVLFCGQSADGLACRTFWVLVQGLLLFPVAEMYFFCCGNFLGCKAGLSLLLVFFPPRPVFFLPRTGFFPPRTVFSRCLQNAFFLLQRCFCAAARCFFCCFEFLPLRSGIFCWRFFPLRKQLFPAARRFFPAAKRVFFRSDVFSCCEPVFFARCAKTRS